MDVFRRFIPQTRVFIGGDTSNAKSLPVVHGIQCRVAQIQKVQHSHRDKLLFSKSTAELAPYTY